MSKLFYAVLGLALLSASAFAVEGAGGGRQ